MDTKKLRQKILDLAIRGKLVPQDPNDEPASVLLERIRAEKERLVKEGKIKKSKTSKTSDTPHYEQVPFEVPSSWVWTTLGEICFFENGYAFSSDDYTTSGIPLIRISNIKDNRISTENCVYVQGDYEDRFQICNGDLLIAMSGATTGKMGVYLSNRKAYLNQRVGNIKVVDSQSLCLEYRNLFLQSKSEEFLKLAYGGAQPNISGAMISSLQVPLPPISEQYRIVAETERWFTLIDKIEQGKTDLQTIIKQTKSKILDLAIHGKLVPQDPNDEPASELLKRINPKAEFTCDNGQYEKLPEGWVTASISNCHIDILNGYAFQSSKYTNEGVRVIRITNVQDGYIEDDSPKYYPLSFISEYERFMLRSNDLLMSLTGNVGRVGFLPESMLPAALNQRVACIRSNEISTKFLFYLFRTNTFKNECVASAKGVAQLNISTEWLKEYTIMVPPLAEQHRIVAKIEELFSALDNMPKALEV